jgi:hypothetical protein
MYVSLGTHSRPLLPDAPYSACSSSSSSTVAVPHDAWVAAAVITAAKLRTCPNLKPALCVYDGVLSCALPLCCGSHRGQG